jgi:hypothetical protein
MITVQHILGDAGDEHVTVKVPSGDIDEGVGVGRIVRHPSADIAILLLAKETSMFDYFQGIAPQPEMGADVAAFGYPEDTDPAGPRPTPRYFKGHVQRLYEHESHLDFQYLGAELSFGAPGGLSGGPVAYPALPAQAMAVVAENRETSAVLSTITDVVEGTNRYREEIRSVISYGICVLLEPLRDWLHEHIRPGLMAHVD